LLCAAWGKKQIMGNVKDGSKLGAIAMLAAAK